MIEHASVHKSSIQLEGSVQVVANNSHITITEDMQYKIH